jgi:multiple sugar transport system permease protein
MSVGKKKTAIHFLDTVATHIVLLAIVCAFAFPTFWVFMTSFKTPREYYSMPPAFLPAQFQIFHYKEAFAPWTVDPTELASNYWVEESAGRVESVTPQIINSLIITLGSVILSLAVGSPAAYAVSRFRFRGSKNLSFWVLSTRMMPPIVIAIPIYWMMRSADLAGTHIGLILVYVMINLPFVVWMMKGFFDDIPIEIEEAARIDGCGPLQLFSRVILPLAIGGIVATALFCVFISWNEFLFAVILTDSRSQTLPVALSLFRQDRGILWGQMSAVIVVATLPILLITLFLQRQVVRGLTAGAVKA